MNTLKSILVVNILKSVLVLLILCTLIPRVGAQDSSPQAGRSDYDKNILKLHISPITLNNFGLQYERMLGKKISVAVSGRFMPQGPVPFLDKLESIIDDPTTFSDLQTLQMGGTAVIPEIRFYLGRHDGPRGFYIAPYTTFSRYNLRLDDFLLRITDEDTQTELRKELDLLGNVRGFTGGLMFGAQWRFGKWVYLDWWFLGASYGSAKGNLDATVPETLSQEWQDELRDRIEGLSVPMVKFEPTVHAHGVNARISGPWAGIKSGLSIGIKF